MVEDGRCTKVTSIDQVTQDQVKRSHVLTLGDLEHPTSRDEPINPRMIGTFGEEGWPGYLWHQSNPTVEVQQSW